MSIYVLDGKVMKTAYQIWFIEKILSLAYEYGWKTTRYDELQSELGLYLQYNEQFLHIKGDECYVTVNHCLNEEDKPSIVDALAKAIEDIPDKDFSTDDFNPDDTYRMESLYGENLYYKLIYWGWDDKKQDLLNFIEGLRDDIAQSQLSSEMEQ